MILDTEQLSKLIIDGKTEYVFDELIKFLTDNDKETLNEISLLYSQFNRQKKEQMLGLSDNIHIANRINLSILQFLTKMELTNTNKNIKFNNLNSTRIEQLENKVKQNTELLNQWEQKVDISENPSEQKRCEIEIDKIKKSLMTYQNEYKTLIS